MTARSARVVAAELIKLWTLPAAAATMLGTVAAAGVLAAALAASAPDGAAILPQLVPFLQVGPVLLGVLGMAPEYAGTQIRTTLIAVPARATALAGKTLAFLVAATLTSGAACVAGLLAGGPVPVGSVVGAGVHLVLVGTLAYALAVLLRALVPALVGMLGLLLVVGPLLAPVTGLARWLPDRAGRALYLPGSDAVLTPWTGALVLLGWIAVVGGVATRAFLVRDA